LRPRQRTARRRRPAPINTPSRGLGNFAAKRSRGMPPCGRGKFLLNGVGATRQGPRRQVARQERLHGRSPPNGMHANNVQIKGRSWLGGTFVASKSGVWRETYAAMRSLAMSLYGRAARRGCSAGPKRGRWRRTPDGLATVWTIAPEARRLVCAVTRMAWVSRLDSLYVTVQFRAVWQVEYLQGLGKRTC